jgi:FkbM family methyltransferase
MKQMAVARAQQTSPDPILDPGVKNFLESFSLGRWGIRAGRQARQWLRALRDPVQHRIWMRQWILPLRNLAVWNRPITLSIDGISVRMVPRGETAGDIWAGLRCETHEVSFILDVVEPGMTFFDVGANAGLFAMVAAKKIGAKNVFAFEPCSATCDLLRQNLRLNHLQEVSVTQAAVGESVSEGVLQVNSRGRDALNTLGQPVHPYSEVVGQEKVRITTIDAFTAEHQIPRVDVMKVDIEGAELMLFRGARELLQRADAPVILYEGFGFLTRGFGYHPVEILWLLESCGFTLLLLDGDTGKISALDSGYQYDSMVIAVKPGHPAYQRLCGAAQ